MSLFCVRTRWAPVLAVVPATVLLSVVPCAPVAVADSPPPAAPRVDFDGDGLEDVAVLVTSWLREAGDTSGTGRGVVRVVYGKAPDTAAPRTQEWQAPAGDAPSFLGLSLAAGDVDGDGYDDLVAARDGGGLSVVFGSAAGLAAARRQDLDAADLGMTPGPDRDPGDPSGVRLAAGDFDGDGYDDVAAGMAEQDLGGLLGGGFSVLYGSPSGLDEQRLVRVTQATAGVPGQPVRGDGFGSVLASGDADGDGRDELAVAAPSARVGRARDSGAVWVFPGSASGLARTGVRVWDQGSPGVPGSDEAGDGFGADLAWGDIDGDGRDDLAIGVPGEDWVRTLSTRAVPVVDGGRVAVLLTAGGSLGTRAASLSQSTPGVPGTGETFDRCYTVAVGDVDGDGHAELVTGCPWESAVSARIGAVLVTRGGPGGLDPAGTSFWTPQRDGVPGAEDAYRRVGADVLVRDRDGDGHPEVLAGARDGVLQLDGTAAGVTSQDSTMWDAWHAGWVPDGYRLRAGGTVLG